jgi:hypothetical protein
MLIIDSRKRRIGKMTSHAPVVTKKVATAFGSCVTAKGANENTTQCA